MIRRTKAFDEGCENYMGLPEEQKEPESAVIRFFKIMFAKDYSEVLYLPPKFARIVGDLVGQVTAIENLNSQKWDVKISLIDHSLVIKEGWPKFFRDNNLQHGDVLVFDYVSGSHFSVDIYNRKNACQKKDFTKGKTRSNKRFKKNPKVRFQITDVNTVDELGLTIALASGSKLQKSQSNLMNPIVSFINLEDPIYMLNRDGENLEKVLGGLTALPRIHVEEQKETNGDDTQLPLNHLSKVVEDFNVLFTEKCHSKPSDNGNSRKVMPDDVSKSRKGAKGFLPSDTVYPSICSSIQVAKRENAFTPKPFDSSLQSSLPIANSVKQAIGIKKQLMQSRKKPVGCAKVSRDAGKLPNMAMKFGQTSSPIVKAEPDLSNDIVPSVAASSFRVKVKSQSYLELPVRISSSKHAGLRKVVSLRDSSGRYWTVIHCELYFVRALTVNWRSFCEANGIKPGDICEFHLNKDIPCIYTVIVHKSRSTS